MNIFFLSDIAWRDWSQAYLNTLLRCSWRLPGGLCISLLFPVWVVAGPKVFAAPSASSDLASSPCLLYTSAVPRHASGAVATRQSVQLARPALEGVFLFFGGWTQPHGGVARLRGGVLHGGQPIWSMGATRDQLRKFGPVSYTHLDVYKRQQDTVVTGVTRIAAILGPCCMRIIRA